MPSFRRPSWHWLILAAAACAGALVLCGVNYVATALKCSLENNSCATTVDLRDYRGRLFDFEGRPAPDFILSFRSDVYVDDALVTTDSQGRFCVQAVRGQVIPFIVVPGQEHVSQLIVRSRAPIDRRFADPRVRASLKSRNGRYRGPDRRGFLIGKPTPYSSPPSPGFGVIGATDATRLWDPGSDGTAPCEPVDARVPWYHGVNPKATWQFAALTAVPLAVAALFLFGVVTFVGAVKSRSNRSAAAAQRCFQGACIGSLVALFLFLILRSPVGA